MAVRRYSVFGVSFWRQYMTTMRPYLLFVSGSAGMVGLSFVERGEIWRTILAFIPLFLSYGLGQALTDCFQTDTDALSSPYRPLVRQTISRKQVLSVSMIGLAAGVAILGYLNPVILIFGSAAVLGLLTYTIFKRTWWGGPPWNSWIVALLPVIGRLTDRVYDIREVFNLANQDSRAFFFVIMAVFFGYANFVVMGYFKDISADRATGYRTFPVAFGWGATAVYSDLLALGAAIFAGLALLSVSGFGIVGLIIYASAVLLSIYAQIRIHLTRDERQAHKPIADVVRVFNLYSAAIVVTLQLSWLPVITVYYILFELVLKFRPEESQV
ncbi:MAG: UbiA family prenyltransferase [candidate division WOR-3 bacterium]|nr:MAG: UbiA family prenyltransferase [candidate division WOR-3 bacterium]